MDRARRMRRIFEVQTQLHRLEEVRLAEIERQARDLEEARIEVAHSLGSDSELHGLFVDVMARRLVKLGKEGSALDAAMLQQRAVVLERGSKAKMAEKLAEGLEKQLSQEQQKKLLAEIIERYRGASE
jgi:hypothetical protein